MQNKKKASVKTTQSFLRIAEIKNDAVVLDDGTLRAIVAVSFSQSNQRATLAITRAAPSYRVRWRATTMRPGFEGCL